MQLPPSLQHEYETARAFFQSLRERVAVDVVCEPRHRTWFTDEARQALDDARIRYVRAVPPSVGAALPNALSLMHLDARRPE
ncbi:hypothetical protein HMI51_33515 [Corallococcus coralloides]|nr:hypothetical protein [Corallococcus coralloides]